jgi:hypothetical protein
LTRAPTILRDHQKPQAFAMKLFGGLIGWRANKQDTIITSTTEAELLALAQAAKESMYVSKLLQKLIIDFNDQIPHPLEIFDQR